MRKADDAHVFAGCREFALPSVTRRQALTSLSLSLPALAWSGALSAQFVSSGAEWTKIDLTTNDYLTLPVRVNGRAMQGVIDSGAMRSVIRPDIALEMALPYLGTATAETFTQQLSGLRYRVATLEVSGVDLHEIPVNAFDTSGFVRRTHQDLSIILGQDVLKAVEIEVDFVGNRIRSLSPRSNHAWPNHKAIPLYGVRDSFPSVHLLLERQYDTKAIIDFGNNVPMLMSADFARNSGLLKSRQTSTTMGVGISGPVFCQTFCLERVQIGPFSLHRLPVQIIENWRMTLPIYVGWTFLRGFDAVLDLGYPTLRLKPDRAILASDFPKDRSGLSAQREGDRMIIIHVARNSPSWTAGLRDNDVIISIDGLPISVSYPPPGTRLGIQPIGTAITIGLADGRQIILTLADYF